MIGRRTSLASAAGFARSGFARSGVARSGFARCWFFAPCAEPAARKLTLAKMSLTPARDAPQQPAISMTQ
jgi:hypothetical protein